jgi:hypothetical protein
MKGIGYHAYPEFRRLNEGHCISRGAQERPGYERYIVYFGRAYLEDFETGVVARGPLKIGRGKFGSALMRGRNQPGIDFRIYAEIVLDCNDATYACEEIVKDALSHRNIEGNQGQKELYDIKDKELKKTVETIVSIFESEIISHKILEVVYFKDDENHKIIPFSKPVKKNVNRLPI